MKKRKSVKEAIEEKGHPYIEHRFIKYAGEEPIEVTDYEKSIATEAHADADKFYEATKRGNYTDIHTHPTGAYDLTKNNPLPSEKDLEIFLKSNMKKMVIAVRQASYSGVVIGYHVIKKTKKTPKRGSKDYDKYFEDLAEYKRQTELYAKSEPEKRVNAFDELTKKYHIQHRLVPFKGYEVNNTRSAFVKKGRLEQKLAVVVLISLTASVLFFSPTFTGKAISNLNEQSSFGVGAIFFIAALIGLFFYMKKKRQKI